MHNTLFCHGCFRVPSPPPKRKKIEKTEDKEGVPDLLQGEVARLPHRFKVERDFLYHPKSKTIHLICKLGIDLENMGRLLIHAK